MQKRYIHSSSAGNSKSLEEEEHSLKRHTMKAYCIQQTLTLPRSPGKILLSHWYTDTPLSITHRDLDRLQKWADRNPAKTDNGECEVLHLKRNNPKHQYMLGADQLQNTFAETNSRVFGGQRVIKQVPLRQRRQQYPGLYEKQHQQQHKEGDHFPLLSTGEVLPGVQCHMLGSPVQDRHEHTEVTQVKGHKDD